MADEAVSLAGPNIALSRHCQNCLPPLTQRPPIEPLPRSKLAPTKSHHSAAGADERCVNDRRPLNLEATSYSRSSQDRVIYPKPTKRDAAGFPIFIHASLGPTRPLCFRCAWRRSSRLQEAHPPMHPKECRKRAVKQQESLSLPYDIDTACAYLLDTQATMSKCSVMKKARRSTRHGQFHG